METIYEEQLAEVAGGWDNPLKCFFTPKTNVPILENGAWWLECASSCSVFCACMRMNYCRDKKHLIDPKTNELRDYYHSNHRDKHPNRGYNT